MDSSEVRSSYPSGTLVVVWVSGKICRVTPARSGYLMDVAGRWLPGMSQGPADSTGGSKGDSRYWVKLEVADERVAFEKEVIRARK